ncbi:MAG: extracellular solute-binding protein, partial [Thermodesulfobacteriota bacterium]
MRLKRRLLLSALLTVLVLVPAAAPAQEKVTLTHALALGAAPKYAEGFAHFDYVNPEAPKGGTLKEWAMGTFDSLNPFIVKGASAAGLGLIYDTLAVGSSDEPFTMYGLIAEKIELPEDRSYVIYHIHPEARFHDGRPITADDVVFSFYTLVEKGDPHYQGYYADVQKVEALDQRRVKFHLGQKTNPELALIVGQLPVLPRHFWEGRDFAATTLEVPLGNGPYRIADFKPGRSITYERVKDYWARDLPVVKGMYNFDRIVYDYYLDSVVALQAFKSGEFDFIQESAARDWATEYQGPPFNAGMIVKEEIPNDVDQGMQAFVFNTRRSLFQDRKVREALAYAFDFEWTNQNIFYGQYTRSASFFANSELASSGPPPPEELEILEPFRDRLPPEVFE